MSGISRRGVVTATGAAVAAAVPAGFANNEANAQQPAAQPTTYLFFNADEVAFVEAAVARLIPADDKWPGALEAGQARALPACNNCHGPGGTGEFPAIPYLAGQYADYTVLQLQMWQSGARKDSADAMADIAKRLSSQDMAAVAAYYQQLREAPVQAAK